MQITTNQFVQLSRGDLRPLTWQFAVSFAKQFDDSVTFFTLDSSLLDGSDILASDADDSVLTEWAKYSYTDYSDRILSLEWSSELDFFNSVIASIADIELNNYDNFFTRGGGSAIEQYLLPRRPVKLLAGFKDERIPQFVGLTDKAPQINRKQRTATLHAEDFLSYIFAKRLDQSVMYVDQRVDEILENLFASAGVIASQMILDIARTTVPFAFFTKDQTIGDAVRDLMQAEMGSLYMDEKGFIVFLNRLRASGASVMTFDSSNIIDYDNSAEASIVNNVKVKAEVREVQPMQVVYSSVQALKILPSSSAEFFFQFEDPVTAIDDIDAYIANSSEDGSGTDVTSSVTVTDTDLFSDTVKVTFANATAFDAYITTLNILGTPARITKIVNVIEKDQTSIDEFEEQTLEIESPYIQDTDNAESIALTLVRHFKDYGNTITMDVKGTPALQLNDVVTIDIDDINDDFIVRKIEHQLRDNKYVQKVTAQKYEIPSYFTLDESQLDGEDVLAA